MKNEINSYEKGKGRFHKKKERKPSSDKIFMQHIAEITGADSRQQKAILINEWKRGWDDGKKESEAEAKAEPIKKKAKKKAKRKTKRKAKK